MTLYFRSQHRNIFQYPGYKHTEILIGFGQGRSQGFFRGEGQKRKYFDFYNFGRDNFEEKNSKFWPKICIES